MTGRARMILVVVGVVLVCVVFYFLFIRARQNELGQVRTDISNEQSRTVQLQSELARLRDLQDRAFELEADLAEIRDLVPQDDEVPAFLTLVQDAATASGVDLDEISPELPKPPPEGAPLAEIRARIRVEGGYFALQDFVRRMYELDRAVRVDNLTMNGSEDPETAETTISLEMTARIFFENVLQQGQTTAPPAGTAPAPAPAPSPSP